MEPLLPCDSVDSDKPAPFDHITENLYLTDRWVELTDNSSYVYVCVELRHVKESEPRGWYVIVSLTLVSVGVVKIVGVVTCFSSEMDDPSEACGENCLNRVLMIEW